MEGIVAQRVPFMSNVKNPSVHALNRTLKIAAFRGSHD